MEEWVHKWKSAKGHEGNNARAPYLHTLNSDPIRFLIGPHGPFMLPCFHHCYCLYLEDISRFLPILFFLGKLYPCLKAQIAIFLSSSLPLVCFMPILNHIFYIASIFKCSSDLLNTYHVSDIIQEETRRNQTSNFQWILILMRENIQESK